MPKKSEEHHHPELLATPQKSIKVPADILPPGVESKIFAIDEKGKKPKGGWKNIYKQGYQRGETAAASVREMRKEAGKTHAWHVPSTNDPPPTNGIPIPNYVKGMMTMVYEKGYLAGWAASNAPKPKKPKSKKPKHH